MALMKLAEFFGVIAMVAFIVALIATLNMSFFWGVSAVIKRFF